MSKRLWWPLIVAVALVAAACAGASDDSATSTTTGTDAPAAQATTTTASAPATTATEVATTTTEVATTTTTTTVEAVEVSVMFSELSDSQRGYTAAVCSFAVGDISLMDLGVESFFQLAGNVLSGWTAVPELEAAWGDLSDAQAETNEFLDAAVPICMAIGWSPEA